MKKLGLFLLCLLALSAASGCDNVKPSISKIFHPSELVTVSKGDNDNAHESFAGFVSLCGLPSMGTNCSYTSTTDLLVGYHTRYDNGTEPLNCWEWVACTSRGFVYFDLSELTGKTIRGARLQYIESSNWFHAGEANNTTECLGTLNVLTAPYTYGWSADVEVLFASPDPNDDLTTLVQEWANGTKPNYGLLFRGTDETLPDYGIQCEAKLTNIELFVLYADS